MCEGHEANGEVDDTLLIVILFGHALPLEIRSEFGTVGKWRDMTVALRILCLKPAHLEVLVG